CEHWLLAHRGLFPRGRDDRPTHLPDDGGAGTDPRPRRRSSAPDSTRLLGWILGRVLAAPARLPRCERPERHLDVHQASRPGLEPGPPATGSRGRHLGAAVRAPPRSERARSRLSHRRRERPARVTPSAGALAALGQVTEQEFLVEG